MSKTIEDSRFTLPRPGAVLAGYRWKPSGTLRAVVVVAHGMGEHAMRYRPALAQLLDAAIIIYALDHRGHGASIELSGGVKGDFGPGGFDAVVEDLAALVQIARTENPGLPLFLLGHSMGSFVGQAFLIEHGGLLDGAVLVGTTAVDLLADAMAKEPDALAALNRPFEPARTPCDWLSTDEQQVDAYLNDLFCGFSLIPASMISLLSQGARLADGQQLSRIRPDLPLYILLGGKDSLTTTFGKLQPLLDRYIAVGLHPEVAIYPQGRHEILNERNRTEVVNNLLHWLNAHIDQAPSRVADR